MADSTLIEAQSKPQAVASQRPPGAARLAYWQLRQLLNLADQQLRRAPLQTLMFILVLLVIWIGLYGVLLVVMRKVASWEIDGQVAYRQIYLQFFFVLSIMLAFSNAVLAFGSLYGRAEASHLMSLPLHARQVVLVKWVEGLVISSWAFLLLGIPLMMAIANEEAVDWRFYVLFTGHFVGFVIIPATVGMLAAWLVARVAPSRPLTMVLWAAAVAFAAVAYWVWRATRDIREPDEWLRRLLEHLDFARSVFLPSSWTARGMLAAIEPDVDRSLFYLAIVLANGAFFVWLTVNLVGGSWLNTYSNAQQGRAGPAVRDGWITAGSVRLLYFYLPRPLQVLMLKDVRMVTRDPTQWLQLVLMVGLLVTYAANLRNLPQSISGPQVRDFIALINLGILGLILAMMTSRFIFPLISLETQNFWLLGQLPVESRSYLLVKFLLSLTITGISAALVVGLATSALNLSWIWSLVTLAISLGICVGLSGLAVGIGAIYPVVGARNPARIASGFGGTVNLIASMILVGTQIAGLAYVMLQDLAPYEQTDLPLPPRAIAIVVGLVVFSMAVGVAALLLGDRRLKRLEL